MPHSLPRVWIHLVFHTKHSLPLIDKNVEASLYGHIRDNIERRLECSLEAIGGMPDHLHLLIRLNQHHSVKELARRIKGESSHWMNQRSGAEQFRWQIGYGAFSVSESMIMIVKRYIKRQEYHHRAAMLMDEFEKTTRYSVNT